MPLDQVRIHISGQAGRKRSSEAADDDVVARTAIENVLTAIADQHVVACTSSQGIVSDTSDQDVVSIATIAGELDCAGTEPGGLDHIVAGEAVDDDAVEICFEAGDVDLRCQTHYRDAATIAEDKHHIVAARRVDDDSV